MRVLLVEDDTSVAKSIELMLQAEGFIVDTTDLGEDGLEIGKMKLPKGTYAIWVLPTEKDWTAILNSDAKAFHLDYRASKDIGSVKMNLKALDKPVESLTFEVRSDGGNKGTLALLWEKTEASFPFTVV